MNKPLLLLVFLALAIFAFRFLNDGQNKNIINNPATPSPVPTVTISTLDSVKNLLAKKYDRSVDSVNLELSQDSGLFAKGSVSFKGEMGGGLWFAAKTTNGWELAYDGQGIMSCELANKFNFPADMVPGCIDTANKNTFVKR